MILSVASGKGGTGKTLVATSLALSIKDDHRVQLLDCDVEEPNDHLFLKSKVTSSQDVITPIPKINEVKCTHCGVCAEVCAYNAIATLAKRVLIFPELCHGCGVCSYFCPHKAISEVPRAIGTIESGYSDSLELIQGRLKIGEAMAPPIIRKVKEHAANDSIAIVDVPPGTSCPVVEAVKGSDFCLLVTEPTPFGLYDLDLAVQLMRQLDIPFGVILNRAGVGNRRIQDYCQKENIPILLIIPLEREIAYRYSRGIPFIAGSSQWISKFQDLLNKIKALVNERNCSIKR